ncbi:MAG: AAA family ATPase, partial [Firmicutes bacterium]|nr:AAA family ATPase [Bacillota bacterium]
MAKTFTDYTPKEIVAELDKYIIGQESAKKSVAVALRNRYRRNQLSEEMREEISPKNILMMGPTGVGKTEIARRLAKLMDAPFVKVEATKFTEVGYVGRDVDSMVRDLMEASLRVTKQKRMAEKYEEAAQLAEEKIIEAIIPGKKKQSGETVRGPFDFLMGRGTATYNQTSEKIEEHKEPVESETELAREQVRQQLREGLLEEQYIEIDVQEQPKDNNLDVAQGGMISLGSIFGDAMPKRTKKKNVKVKDARKILTEQEVSAHYLLTDEAQPKIYRLVDENRAAWHAGNSSWKNFTQRSEE